eukprot:5727041-Amphidinium_carterae.1
MCTLDGNFLGIASSSEATSHVSLAVHNCSGFMALRVYDAKVDVEVDVLIEVEGDHEAAEVQRVIFDSLAEAAITMSSSVTTISFIFVVFVFSKMPMLPQLAGGDVRVFRQHPEQTLHQIYLHADFAPPPPRLWRRSLQLGKEF